ncbi:major capsid protein [Fictibacillus aquaticus]|uniref:Major capsid protein E n=1 Tax=Fictibacillus aquaticus TaxID=2021314 RepID=A0A235FB54_9BACL|nr:major capsid protein [Fictibacillus aquaticus]OYD58472.1 hypothetical protein CGZ90_00800 [Fictibacillus aquaticus]
MPLHLDEFQKEEFLGYVENVPAAKDYLLRSFLPNKQMDDLDFTYNIFNGKYTKAAKVTGLNAGAPLRDKQGIDKAMGQLAKIQTSFRLDEREMFRFNNPRNTREAEGVVNYIYEEVDDLVNSVYDTEEWMRARALYHGGFDYNQDGVVIKFDYNIPGANKLTATTAWSDQVNSNPLTDLRAAVKQFRAANKNRKPVVMHISEAVEADLLANQQIKLQIRGEVDKRLITSSDLQNVFSSLGLPPYQVQDDMIDIDDGNGEQALLPERRIVFLGQDLGFTGIGPTVEKNWESGIYVVTKIQETDPPMQAVFVGETAFPAFQRPSAVVWLNV